MVTARRSTAFPLTTTNKLTGCDAIHFFRPFDRMRLRPCAECGDIHSASQWRVRGRTYRSDIKPLISARLQPLRNWFSGCCAGPLGAGFLRTRLSLPPRKATFSALLASLCLVALFFTGCGQTAKPVTASSAGKVNSYFGGPFQAVGLSQSTTSFDHPTNQISVSTAIGSPGLEAFISGTFVTADTGFSAITENFANGSPQNPPMTGAWAVEIPGAGAIANLLSMNGATVTAGPAFMADSSACPNFTQATPFLYVTVPTPVTNGAAPNPDTADFGGVDISVQGSAVTFTAHPWLVGPLQQPASTSTGGCSNTALGALTAYPLNSFGNQSTYELIGIDAAGLLVSSYNGVGPVTPGAFGGGTGIIGVAEPYAPLDISAVVGANYNGFFYAPRYGASQFTVLASAYGNHSGTSQACATLQTSLAANNGQGATTVQALPSANSLYGGEFLATTSTGVVNDPTGATGSENCDVVIDLGQQGLANGLFPNATVFIGSNFPPFSATNPWSCLGSATCAVSFPATAVVGNVLGRYVIFVVASGVSTPPAQLPGAPLSAQPIGIYLFQNM
jgi:hypothetical protein